ncbi:MAG: hypothetical protein J0I79_16510 [Mesorhizobium sp.]|uniref:hypothetical protein n=1 Tax=Mesorhizobium sp. TaxID=1871066 RepID=UPI001AC9AAC3|nr:hypothetical protein [Mesorhizobium sp.]MBN9219549.1 hypothetical protein [Mesorhizobium sp.]
MTILGVAVLALPTAARADNPLYGRWQSMRGYMVTLLADNYAMWTESGGRYEGRWKSVGDSQFELNVPQLNFHHTCTYAILNNGATLHITTCDTTGGLSQQNLIQVK